MPTNSCINLSSDTSGNTLTGNNLLLYTSLSKSNIGKIGRKCKVHDRIKIYSKIRHKPHLIHPWQEV